MQPVTGIGVSECHFLIQFNSEAGFGWRDHIALLPADRLFQELCIEAAESFNAFEDEEGLVE